MFKRFRNRKSKHSPKPDNGPPRKLFLHYRLRSNREFQNRNLFSSNKNLRSTIEGYLNSVAPPGTKNIWYQVTRPPDLGVMTMDEIVVYVRDHTVLGNGNVGAMDVVVWDVPPVQKSMSKHREHATGCGGRGEVVEEETEKRCVVQ